MSEEGDYDDKPGRRRSFSPWVVALVVVAAVVVMAILVCAIAAIDFATHIPPQD